MRANEMMKNKIMNENKNDKRSDYEGEKVGWWKRLQKDEMMKETANR